MKRPTITLVATDTTKNRQTLTSGQQYSKKGRAVLIPVYGPHDEVILPPSQLQWLCRQPDDMASSHAAQNDVIQLEYSLGRKFALDAWGGWLLKSDLNGVLETVCAVMNDEVGAAVDAAFDTGTGDVDGIDGSEWRELNLFAACRAIIGRATLRATLGDSPEGRRLCKDNGFVESCYQVLDGMLTVAGAVAACRRIFTKSWFAWWASRVMPPKLKDLAGRFEPLYRERLRIITEDPAHPASLVDKIDEPRDIIQMMLRYAVRERPDEARNLGDITRRLALSNFGTMHQSVVTLHNMMLNILSSDAEFDTVAMLRAELTSAPEDAPWTRARVASLTRADSAARETLRLHSFIGRTVQRLIVAPDGLTTPDGVHLPQGAMVSILAHQAQTDPDAIGADADKYDPFRFSRAREAATAAANASFVSTGADFLPWSHGRHACPGRFLVDFELKMILAYALANYDLALPESYGGKRPENTWFSGFGIPPLDAKIRVRRRKRGRGVCVR